MRIVEYREYRVLMPKDHAELFERFYHAQVRLRVAAGLPPIARSDLLTQFVHERMLAELAAAAERAEARRRQDAERAAVPAQEAPCA